MNDLLRLLKPVRRIRGNRLYLPDGTRILDLWLDDGYALLGDSGKSAVLYASNAAEKGLTRAYPGQLEARLHKALKETWPEFGSSFLFANEERAVAAVEALLKKKITIVDCASPDADNQDGGIALARPFMPVPDGFALALARLPCARPYAPACVLVRKGEAASALRGELLPGLMHAAAARALDTLARAELNGYSEKHWDKFGKIFERHFTRRGPYLFRRDEAMDYERLFKAALAGGALISPSPLSPSIVPPDFSDGEAKNLAAALDALYP